jgi:hypothetical protein
MNKHSPTHYKRPTWSGSDRTDREPCGWYPYPANGPTRAGFGIDRHNDHVTTITGDGLRWSTETAELIAAKDGEEWGCYLFRTQGGRYFEVRHNYPMRYDRTDPLRIISIDEATRLYADITGPRHGIVVGEGDPFAVAFPTLTMQEA